jgi:hypothetical protein
MLPPESIDDLGEWRSAKFRVTLRIETASRVVGWQADGMGVISEVWRGLVLRQRDRPPFGDAEQQARAPDGNDG